MKSTRKGFTLVELLVVIAILAILATVSVVGYTSFIDRANQSTALQEMTQIRDAVIAEDILNPNFSISGGTITVLESTDAGYDDKYPTFDAFVGALVAELGTGKNHVLAADNKSLTLNNTGKNVHATWTFATNDITTDKGTVAGGGNAGGGEGQTPVHTCESVCATCGKCLDAECDEDACADKCPGHPTTLVVTAAQLATAGSWTNANPYYSITYQGVLFEATSGTHNGKYYTNDGGSWRFYSSENGKLTITAPEGKTIKSVTLTWSEGGFSYNSSALQSGTAFTVSGTSITLNATNKTFITKIEVIYQ